jgi:hypothetical protein
MPRAIAGSIDIDQIPNKRLRKRIKLFRQGELVRLIGGVLRKADTPISTQDMTSAIRAAGGHGEPAKPSVMSRVRGNLFYLYNWRKALKTGRGKDVPWQIAQCLSALLISLVQHRESHGLY